MVRWQPDGKGRLAEAAMTLYGERGFDNTTVAEIAERAGLTERTFYRYFADKREVLFGGGDELRLILEAAVARAPESTTPLGLVGLALDDLATVFRDRHAHARRRQAIIVANPELQERELIKLASLASGLATALRARGVPEPTASLLGEAGVAVFKLSFTEWVSGDEGVNLGALMRTSLDAWKAVASDG